jgi:hypothetical protein
MNTSMKRWSPSQVRRIAAATGPLALRDFDVMGEASAQPHFSMPAVPQYADPTVSAMFDVRTYAPGDVRLFEACQRAGVDASTLFSPSPDSVHIPTYQPGMLFATVACSMLIFSLGFIVVFLRFMNSDQKRNAIHSK